MNEMNQNSVRLLVFLLFVFVPRMLWAQDAGVDFSETPHTLAINTSSATTPDVLRLRNITCPTDGFVVAIANGQLQYTAGPNFPGTVAISLSRDSTGFDPNHDLRIFGNYINGLYTGIVSIQRVDECRGGESHAYRFLATNGSNAGDTSMRQPSLILMFFRFRL